MRKILVLKLKISRLCQRKQYESMRKFILRTSVTKPWIVHERRYYSFKKYWKRCLMEMQGWCMSSANVLFKTWFKVYLACAEVFKEIVCNPHDSKYECVSLPLLLNHWLRFCQNVIFRLDYSTWSLTIENPPLKNTVKRKQNQTLSHMPSSHFLRTAGTISSTDTFFIYKNERSGNTEQTWVKAVTADTQV